MMVMITTMTLRTTTITTAMMIMVMMLIMMPMQNPDVVDPKESLKYAPNRCLPSPWYKGRGGGGNGTPPQRFWYVAVFRKDFAFSGKPSQQDEVILWVVRLLEACDNTNNSRHLGRHLRFYQELKIRLKPREIVIFCALHMKKHFA